MRSYTLHDIDPRFLLLLFSYHQPYQIRIADMFLISKSPPPRPRLKWLGFSLRLIPKLTVDYLGGKMLEVRFMQEEDVSDNPKSIKSISLIGDKGKDPFE